MHPFRFGEYMCYIVDQNGSKIGLGEISTISVEERELNSFLYGF